MKPLSIGRYRIESELGTGRFSETYSAYDLVRRRPVALKLLHPGLLPDSRSWRGFLAEVQRAADLVHPHIAWIWETGELDGRHYLVERFVGGETLAAQISQSGPIPADQAVKLLEQVAQAIEFGQQRGWIHGGVNPRNILISPDLGSVLSDYGLLNAARQWLAEEPPRPMDACYLPPEVLRGQPITQDADLYGLACCLVEALSGEPPFSSQSLAEIIDKKSTSFDRPLLPLETFPPQASKVIERAVKPEPSARFKDALSFIDAFESAVRHGLTDEAGRAQHEDQLRLWHEAQEKERIQAEEAARLEAVEIARREIQERARQEAQQIIDLREAPTNNTAQSAQQNQESSRKDVARPTKHTFSWLVLIVLLIAFILGAIWLAYRDDRAGSMLRDETPTSTEMVQTPTSSSLPTRTPEPSSSLRPNGASGLNKTATGLTYFPPIPSTKSTPEINNPVLPYVESSPFAGQ